MLLRSSNLSPIYLLIKPLRLRRISFKTDMDIHSTNAYSKKSFTKIVSIMSTAASYLCLRMDHWRWLREGGQLSRAWNYMIHECSKKCVMFLITKESIASLLNFFIYGQLSKKRYFMISQRHLKSLHCTTAYRINVVNTILAVYKLFLQIVSNQLVLKFIFGRYHSKTVSTTQINKKNVKSTWKSNGVGAVPSTKRCWILWVDTRGHLHGNQRSIHVLRPNHWLLSLSS